jgi:hypothetical protein
VQSERGVKARPIIMPVESPEQRAERAQRIATYLARLDATRPWQLLVEPWKGERTARQNNAMWGPIYGPFCAFTGYTEPELHDTLLRLYFGEVEYEVLGVRKTKPKRTTTTNEAGERDVLSREKMAEFIEFVFQKAAEMGLYIEAPNPMLRTRAA